MTMNFTQNQNELSQFERKKGELSDNSAEGDDYNQGRFDDDNWEKYSDYSNDEGNSFPKARENVAQRRESQVGKETYQHPRNMKQFRNKPYQGYNRDRDSGDYTDKKKGKFDTPGNFDKYDTYDKSDKYNKYEKYDKHDKLYKYDKFDKFDNKYSHKNEYHNKNYQYKDYDDHGDRGYKGGYKNRGYDNYSNYHGGKDYKGDYRDYNKDYHNEYTKDYNNDYRKDYNRDFNKEYNRDYNKDYYDKSSHFEKKQNFREYDDDIEIVSSTTYYKKNYHKNYDKNYDTYHNERPGSSYNNTNASKDFSNNSGTFNKNSTFAGSNKGNYNTTTRGDNQNIVAAMSNIYNTNNNYSKKSNFEGNVVSTSTSTPSTNESVKWPGDGRGGRNFKDFDDNRSHQEKFHSDKRNCYTNKSKNDDAFEDLKKPVFINSKMQKEQNSGNVEAKNQNEAETKKSIPITNMLKLPLNQIDEKISNTKEMYLQQQLNSNQANTSSSVNSSINSSSRDTANQAPDTSNKQVKQNSTPAVNSTPTPNTNNNIEVTIPSQPSQPQMPNFNMGHFQRFPQQYPQQYYQNAMPKPMPNQQNFIPPNNPYNSPMMNQMHGQMNPQMPMGSNFPHQMANPMMYQNNLTNYYTSQTPMMNYMMSQYGGTYGNSSMMSQPDNSVNSASANEIANEELDVKEFSDKLNLNANVFVPKRKNKFDMNMGQESGENTYNPSVPNMNSYHYPNY